ncbi:hypothetical protein CUMW_282440 [Citrus unshiu]|uniref:F-box domain-containing protein n=1 Tax=Citrus unshiu TaxID=55188 RepID=A0A2H5N2P5_CITUN|nr:hypothetical protein CUMW_282440 [Citrus unshiu]
MLRFPFVMQNVKVFDTPSNPSLGVGGDMDDRDPLPLHIIDHILSRLHVKQLLRLRCVSKTWRNLIDGPDFIKLQLSRNQARDSSIITVGLGSTDTLYEIAADSCYLDPSTRKHRLLPTTTTTLDSKTASCFLYGFGYDLTHDDYKLVRIAKRSGDACFSEAAEISRDSPGVYASGSLHWIAMAEYGRHDFILALDLSDEAYKELPLPPPVLLETGCRVRASYLGVLDNGCLCMVSNYSGGYRTPLSHVWVMTEYGVKDSWTKLFSISEEQVISPSPEFYYYSLPFESLEPLAFYEGGTQLLLAHNKINFLVYDLNTNQATVRWPEPDVAPMPVNTFKI